MKGFKRDEAQAQKNHHEALKLLAELGLISDDDVKEAASKIQKSSKSGQLYVGKALAVDDSATIRLEMQYFLERTGIEVKVASNGDEAWQIIKNEDFSVIFCDLNMPVLNGIGLLEKLQAAGKKIPFIMVTTESGVKEIMQAKNLGAIGWLIKPTTFEAVSNVIKKFCQTRKAS